MMNTHPCTLLFFFFQAEDGIRYLTVTGVQTCALPIWPSFAMLTPDQLDTPMDFESLKHAGTGLGSAGVIVVDDQTCMVATALKYGNFFKVESCGQCPPCRMGTINLAELLQKIEDGDGTEKDLASLLQLCGFVKGRGYCTVVTGASVVVESSLRMIVPI